MKLKNLISKAIGFYETVNTFVPFILGIVTAFMSIYEEQKHIGAAIILTIGTVVMGTLCFLIFPMMCMVFYHMFRVSTVLALPIFIFMYIGYLFGDPFTWPAFNGENTTSIFTAFWQSTALSAFGLLNIYTIIKTKYMCMKVFGDI